MTAEPIAIIGMSCKFPGAPDLDAYWRLLEGGVDTVRTVPRSRWDIERFYDTDIDAPGKMITRWGAFLDHPEHFDAEFFDVTADEAERVDPQQRLILEVAWEALEDACVAPDSLSGGEAGVFMGVSHSDYERIIYEELEGVCAHDGPGAYHALTANRLSFALNLKGPSMVVDSACSSSLTAIHVACQNLQLGECPIAIVGGVNLNLTPEETIGLTKARMMSPHGRCMTFDARADGYVRGEGAGVLILKRLSDAERDGDRVRAVIRGTAVNHNGRSNGVTAPNGPAQQALLRRALARASVSPADVSYVELHGTGTKYGDPIEVGALKAVLGAPDERGSTCYLGTAKTNIGHLEAASGVAGVIKVVLSLERGLLPRNLHLDAVSPHIDLEGSRLRILRHPEKWPSRRRVAGVSAFGFGGANAHVVLEQRPEAPASELRARRELLLLSAKTGGALVELAERLAAHCSGADVNLTDVCYSAMTGRAQLACRAAFLADDAREMAAKLADFASKREWSAPAALARRPKVGLWMQRAPHFFVELERHVGPYAAALDLFRKRVRPESVPDPESRDALTDYCQRLAGAELLRAWGIGAGLLGDDPVTTACALTLAGKLEPERAREWLGERGGLAPAPAAVGSLHLLLTLGGAEPPAPAGATGAERLEWDHGGGAWADTLRLLGALYERGLKLNMASIAAAYGGSKVSLPTYPFQHRAYWVRPYEKSQRSAVAPRQAAANGAAHPVERP